MSSHTRQKCGVVLSCARSSLSWATRCTGVCTCSERRVEPSDATRDLERLSVALRDDFEVDEVLRGNHARLTSAQFPRPRLYSRETKATTISSIILSTSSCGRANGSCAC
ncbi:hypothetical protein PHLGIDRAFT_270956 [Phlebiopsis gigantea 11061_1 CR5-6]|uniref:Uncharacterized protein n=1 Tax=Phlebiopsis gigantea (strain 11061_1 CR5-6) TaxID=745531 RepID=A0A0C3NE81_PHLG1|nr:hypothetical protein PHLGIDRAFT_270956 [Phlebiopsis gigantea 11061_1 CR5-6]